MAKTDWNALCDTFLKQADQSAKARNSYAERCGVNSNSFRRELAKHKKSLEEKGNSSNPNKSDQRKRTDQTPRSDQKLALKNKKNKTLKNQSNKSKGRGEGSDHTKTDQGKPSTRGRAHVAKNDPNLIRDNGTRCFKKGNAASLIHGGYAEKFFLHDDHENWAKTSLADIHALAKSKYMLMESIRTDLIRQTQLDYEQGRTHIKEVFEEGELQKVPMTFQEAIFAAMMAGHKEQTKLLSDIAKVEQTQQALRVQTHGMSKLSRDEQIEIVADVLTSYAEKEVTAIEAGLLLAKDGIEPPSTLKLLIDKEVEALDESNDGEGGISEEELKALKAKSAEFAQSEEAKINRNREMLAQLLSEEADG
ncbi:hypothetical protein [Vibrio sonorensis]|uniref:hypothetical protein n=1 Tax=Vibrio sonorensis TaxID=1004316 RepID=UPI0008DA8F3B|nr:hypothetical protein [Vibrio sonorensis]